MKNRLIVYTSMYGGYDDLKEVKSSDHVRYVAFTDSMESMNGWEKIDRFVPVDDPRRKSRWFKFHPHILFPGQITIYMDASLQMRLEPSEYLTYLQDANIAITTHNDRECIYDEAMACINQGKDEEHLILRQITKYRELGFPEKYGLFANGFIVRRDEEDVRKWNEGVWKEYMESSCRDQLCGQFVAWQQGIKINGFSRKLVKTHKHK